MRDFFLLDDDFFLFLFLLRGLRRRLSLHFLNLLGGVTGEALTLRRTSKAIIHRGLSGGFRLRRGSLRGGFRLLFRFLLRRRLLRLLQERGELLRRRLSLCLGHVLHERRHDALVVEDHLANLLLRVRLVSNGLGRADETTHLLASLGAENLERGFVVETNVCLGSLASVAKRRSEGLGRHGKRRANRGAVNFAADFKVKLLNDALRHAQELANASQGFDVGVFELFIR